jgi:hypothetical protein
MTQVTVRPSLMKKVKALDDIVGKALESKVSSLASYAVSISPVWSGGFVTSWGVYPRGSNRGRSRTSYPDEISPEAKADAKARATDTVLSDVKANSKAIREAGGAVISNKSKAASIVEAKHKTTARVRAKA